MIARFATEYAEIVAGARHVGDPLRRATLAPLRSAIAAALADEPRLVTGAGVVVCPDLLGDAPLWLEWWTTSAPGPPQPLRPNLDPASVWFYDYTEAEWFTAPRDTAQRSLVGPYVDIGGTNDYMLTLTMAARLGTEFLGVAGADIAIDSLELVVRQHTRRLGAHAILVNTEGRVIASSTGQAHPGALLSASRAPLLERHSASACPGLPLTLLVAR